MQRVSKSMGVLGLSLAITVCCAERPEHITLRGRVVGHDGQPMAAAYASVQKTRMYALNEEFDARMQRFSRAFHQHRASGGNPRQFKYDWSADVAAVRAQLEREEDPDGRTMLPKPTISVSSRSMRIPRSGARFSTTRSRAPTR